MPKPAKLENAMKMDRQAKKSSSDTDRDLEDAAASGDEQSTVSLRPALFASTSPFSFSPHLHFTLLLFLPNLLWDRKTPESAAGRSQSAIEVSSLSGQTDSDGKERQRAPRQYLGTFAA